MDAKDVKTSADYKIWKALNPERKNKAKPKPKIVKYKGDKSFYNHVTIKKGFPDRYRATCEYDFLQYIRIVFKWALENTDLSRGELEVLLYVYPKGVFTRREFIGFYRTLGMFYKSQMMSFSKRGWIKQWRKSKGKKQPALYCLTDKGKVLCARMHKMLTGEEKIPETYNNAIYRNERGTRVSGFYMDVIKEMNKRRDGE